MVPDAPRGALSLSQGATVCTRRAMPFPISLIFFSRILLQTVFSNYFLETLTLGTEKDLFGDKAWESA